MIEFRVSVLARLKYADLREALKRLGWTQKKAAGFLGMSQMAFGRLINLKWVPRKFSKDLEQKLLWLTGKLPEDLWPEFMRSKAFITAKKEIEIIRELTPELLEAQGLLQLPYSPEEEVAQEEPPDLINRTLAKLKPKQERVLRGICYEGKTHRQLAEEMRLSSARIGQIAQTAARKIRGTPLGKELEAYLR